MDQKLKRPRLTRQEKESITRLTAQGVDPKKIASVYGVTVPAVLYHRSKLGL